MGRVVAVSPQVAGGAALERDRDAGVVLGQRADGVVEHVRHVAGGEAVQDPGLGGSVPLALLTGLMLQWLVDPDHAPTGADVIAELRSLRHLRRARAGPLGHRA
ncbi:hypothetical protein [Nonomuraea sp. NPDC050691]|uniref:hypothetical protein n=1 Tax=Nonomuraea sp. NPDC050691 TaxID=3155661 RepID=UPI0033CBF136